MTKNKRKLERFRSPGSVLEKRIYYRRIDSYIQKRAISVDYIFKDSSTINNFVCQIIETLRFLHFTAPLFTSLWHAGHKRCVNSKLKRIKDDIGIHQIKIELFLFFEKLFSQCPLDRVQV